MQALIGKADRMPAHSAAVPHIMRSLKWKGLTVVESCTQTHTKQGHMFLEDHLLLFVLKGQYIVRFGQETITVHRHEMVLLQKSILVAYEKTGVPESDYQLDYMMFFLKDELLQQFIRMANVEFAPSKENVPISVRPMNERLIRYVESVKPYFDEPEQVGEGLVELKLLELLYDVAHADRTFLSQLLQLRQPERRSIAQVVEENLFHPVSVDDLAYLSGRSLSTFKREFRETFNSSPMQWIRTRRLDKARALLANTAMSVTDVCYATGFENTAHFSKAFKERFGIAPSMVKQSADGRNEQPIRTS